ncbi:flightin isoform X2 [Plutella xylostella]|uniref:flightin isoform X2 n=1 Tax=Plutella xylostella TaxID=51655 RepID=UPI0005D073E8|nr:flightin isoform X2 [Plutella xylostella]
MWDVEDEETVEATPEVTEAAPPEPTPEELAAKEAEEAEAAAAEAAALKAAQEPKKLIFKHWVRPKFLQYNYMYDYRHNYYDDVINYLDRRNHGMAVEKPRAQTWAERVLRTYLSKPRHGPLNAGKDTALLRAVSTGSRFHRYHSKSIISRISLS